MTITLKILPELELQLRNEAKQKEVSLERHILQKLDRTGVFSKAAEWEIQKIVLIND